MHLALRQSPDSSTILRDERIGVHELIADAVTPTLRMSAPGPISDGRRHIARKR